MVLRELAAKLGLEVDWKAWAKAGAAMSLLNAGLTRLVDKSIEVAGEFVDMVKTTSASGHEIERTAQMTGLAADELQRLQRASDMAGVGAEAMQHSLILLSRQMAAAKAGGEEQGKVFKKAGVAYKDASGHLRSAGDVTKDLADHFKALPDGAEKTALAMQLFGRSGAQMIPLLNMGGQAIDELGSKATIMTEEQIAASKELVLAQKQLGYIASSVWKGAIYPLIPAIRDLVKQWVAWRKANAEVMKQRLQAFVGAMVTGVKYLGKGLRLLIDSTGYLTKHWRAFAAVAVLLFAAALPAAIGALVGAITSLGTAGMIAGLKMAASWVVAAAPFVAIALIVAALALAIEDLWVAASGGKSLLGDLLPEWAKALVLWKNSSDSLWKDITDGWKMVLGEFFDWLRDTWSREVTGPIAGMLGWTKAAGGETPGMRRVQHFKTTASGARIPSGYGYEPIAPMVSGNAAAAAAAQGGNLTFNITQLPGESGEAFALRVSEIVDEKRRAEYEATAAAVPGSGF